FGLRLLMRNPGLTATIVITLALVIGANAAIFSVLRAVLLRDLPYPNPAQLVLLWGSDRFGDRSQVSYTDLSDWRTQATSIDSAAAFQSWWNPTLNQDNRPEHVAGLQVSGDFFRVMQAA